jgi:hypothetical protein
MLLMHSIIVIYLLTLHLSSNFSIYVHVDKLICRKQLKVNKIVQSIETRSLWKVSLLFAISMISIIVIVFLINSINEPPSWHHLIILIIEFCILISIFQASSFLSSSPTDHLLILITHHVSSLHSHFC